MKYNTQKLIKQKNPKFFNTKLTENIGKLKELSKCPKTLGLASLINPLTNICRKTNDNANSFDDKKKMLRFSKKITADDLLANLFPLSLRFGLPSV